MSPLLERLEGGGLGAALVERDLLREARRVDRFLEKRRAADLS